MEQFSPPYCEECGAPMCPMPDRLSPKDEGVWQCIIGFAHAKRAYRYAGKPDHLTWEKTQDAWFEGRI